MCDDKDLVATCGGIIGSNGQIIKNSYREGLVIDEVITLVIDPAPVKPRKNKSDRKRNRKQRWC